MIRLDAATVLLQWAVGGLLFTWITTRHREVGLGYGWLMRGTYLLIAIGAVFAGRIGDTVIVRDLSATATAVAALAALVVSILRRGAGVSGEAADHDRRSARVAAMTGIDRDVKVTERTGAEFPPVLDLVAPAIGVVGLVAAALAAGDSGGADALAVVRTLAGAAFLGAITDAMLLGHWYLVQPGLARRHLNELVRWVAWVWPIEIVALVWPTGMVSVLNGTIDDGWGGTLGWFWLACAIGTLVLAFVTQAALKERAYSAVMAATGLLYLAILTGFGTDLVARAVLAN
ncbi:MAG: hypothetical protein AB7L13_23765 [Acidimicrobiia bacterium]